jgi:hypothetical protein
VIERDNVLQKKLDELHQMEAEQHGKLALCRWSLRPEPTGVWQ